MPIWTAHPYGWLNYQLITRILAGTVGAYSIVGAESNRGRVGCLVLAGPDFPVSVAETLESWDIMLHIARDPSRLSTRSILQYQGENFSSNYSSKASSRGTTSNNFCWAAERTFAYTTEPLQPTPSDLEGTPLLQSKAFHFLATPEQLTNFASQLARTRAANRIDVKPLLIWEPAPPSCNFAARDAHLQAARLVDIYSPNHVEFLATFEPNDKIEPPMFDKNTIRNRALSLLQSGVGKDGEGVVIIRCGENGSLVASRSFPARWFPAAHDCSSDKVVDATGAGNAFLGGFTVGMGETVDLEKGAIAGAVAASFVIEQVGLPSRTIADGKEMWNGEDVLSRIQSYRAKLLSA